MYIFLTFLLQLNIINVYIYRDDEMTHHEISLYSFTNTSNDKHLWTRESNRTSRICAWTNRFRTMLEILKMIQFTDSSEWPRNQWRWWFNHWIQQLRNCIRYERENSNNQTILRLRIQRCIKTCEKRWWRFVRISRKSRRIEWETSKHNLLWNKIVFYFIITYQQWKTQQEEQDSICMTKSMTSETDSRKCERNIEQNLQFDSERITIKSSLNESAVLHSIWQSSDWKLWLLWTSQSLKKWKKSNRLLPNIYFTTTIQMIRTETLYSLLEAFIDTNYIDSDDILDCLWLDVEKYSKRFWKKLYEIRERYFEALEKDTWITQSTDLDDYVEEAYMFVHQFIS